MDNLQLKYSLKYNQVTQTNNFSLKINELLALFLNAVTYGAF